MQLVSRFLALKHADFSSQFCTKPDFQKSVQVCILGANTRLGTYTSFLVKQNPLISILHLQGCFPIENMGIDLRFFDTRCRVQTYCGLEQSVSKAVKVGEVATRILPFSANCFFVFQKLLSLKKQRSTEGILRHI